MKSIYIATNTTERKVFTTFKKLCTELGFVYQTLANQRKIPKQNQAVSIEGWIIEKRQIK